MTVTLRRGRSWTTEPGALHRASRSLLVILFSSAWALLPLLLLLLSSSAPVASGLSTDNRWSVLLSGSTRPAQTLTVNDTAFPALLTVSPGARRPRTLESPSFLLSGASQLSADVGVSGVLGVASDSNLPPTVVGASAWTGADGELYQYGGRRATISTDTLWRYSRATSQWSWLRGSSGAVASSPPRVIGLPRRQPNAAANPGGRAFACTTVDTDGNTWLVSGAPVSLPNTFSDIWMLNATTLVWSQFTGVTIDAADYSAGLGNPASGATQKTGPRQGAACWWAKGALYIFGGQDAGAGAKNDM